MSKFFKDLKSGLKDAIAHEKGKLDLRSTLMEIPEPPAEYKEEDIVQRTSLQD